MLQFNLNGKPVEIDVPEDTPLLWVLREELGLTGTKFGCGRGLCGACTIHLNGQAIRCCIIPVAAVKDQSVRTIEALDPEQPHPVQVAWMKHNVPQCGYCQPGQIMQAISVLENQNQPTEPKLLLEKISNNLCRCGTYHKIKTAFLEVAQQLGKLK